MSTDSQLATAPVTPGFHRATSALSEVLGVEPRMMIDTIKKQCFPGMSPDAISDAQLAAFISVANALKLNPLIPGMLYAYPGKNGGIVPVTGPDGVLQKLDECISDGKLDGYECTVFPEDVSLKPTHAVAKIWRKGSERPAVFTAIFGEWHVSQNPNWGSRPRHMIWLRALKQCARQVIHGVPYDEDDVRTSDMLNVTPEAEKPVDRAAPPPRTKKEKGANAVPTTPPAIDVTATPAVEPPKTEKPAETPDPQSATPPPESPKAEPAPGENPAPAKARTTLNANETATFLCVVIRCDGIIINDGSTGKKVPTSSTSATLAGEYAGTVYHIGGASSKDGKEVPNAPWAVGARVKVTLFGRLNNISKQVMTMVTAVEAADAAAVEME